MWRETFGSLLKIHLYVWAVGVIVADRIWVRPARLQEASSDKEQGG